MNMMAAAAALAACIVASTAAAQDRGTYIGIGVGQSRIQADTGAMDAAARRAGFTGSTTSADEHDTAWKLYLGHQYHRNFAVEASYTDFGRFSRSTQTTGPAANLGGSVRGYAVSLDAVGLAPVTERFTLFGKVGLQHWDLDAQAASLAAGVATTATTSARGNDWKLGLGARYDFNRNIGVRFEWERFVNVGDSATTGRSNIDMLAVGVQYRF